MWTSYAEFIFRIVTYTYTLTSTRARTRLGRVAEANYVISAFCPRQTRKSVRIIVPFVLTTDIPGNVLGINPEGITTVSGIFQEYAERLLNECGFTQLDFASCPRPSGRLVLEVARIVFSFFFFRKAFFLGGGGVRGVGLKCTGEHNLWQYRYSNIDIICTNSGIHLNIMKY